MAYINTATGIYPYSVDMLRRDYPQTSFPATPTDALLAEFGVYPLYTGEIPTYDPIYQTIEEIQPAYDGISWVRQWSVRDFTQEELEVVRINLHIDRRDKRTQAEACGFAFRDKRIDSDKDSILRITQATLLASQSVISNQPFSVSWVCDDDSILELDAAGMLEMQSALTMHGLLCHNRSQTLKTLLDSAIDGPSLSAAASELETGWPI